MIIKKICPICKQLFIKKLKPSDIKKGRGKYCSHRCYYISKKGKKLSSIHKQRISQGCKGKAGIFKRTPSMKIGKYKRTPEMKTGKHMIGSGNHHWKGGRIKTSDGYFWIYLPNHPFANSNKRVFEQRLVMEKHLGRYLKPQEVVHHIDGNKTNNHISNLMLFPNTSAHRRFHRSYR